MRIVTSLLDSVLYKGAIGWNSLPVNIRNIDSYDSAKKKYDFIIATFQTLVHQQYHEMKTFFRL